MLLSNEPKDGVRAKRTCDGRLVSLRERLVLHELIEDGRRKTARPSYGSDGYLPLGRKAERHSKHSFGSYSGPESQFD